MLIAIVMLMRCPNCDHEIRSRHFRRDLDTAGMSLAYRSGASIRAVAEQFGCSYSTARARLAQAGVAMRPRARKAAGDGVR